MNPAKSGVARPWRRKLLGFSFTSGLEPKRWIAPQVFARLKGWGLTRRARRVSDKQRVEELSRYLVGWRGYFGFCETPSVLRELDSWIRRRLRCAVWKGWKRGRTRFAELHRRGVGKDLATMTAGSAHGVWRISRSPALNRALPNAFLDALGLPRLACRPTAQPNRRVRTRTHGGVPGKAREGPPMSIDGFAHAKQIP